MKNSLVAFGTLLLATTLPAHANPAFDLEQLSLDPAAVDSLIVSSGRTLPARVLRLGVATHGEKDPLVVRVNGATAGALISARLTTHLFGAFALTDRLEIEAEIPLIAWQTGADLSAFGVSTLESSGLGNPLFAFRYGWLSTARDSTLDLSTRLSLGLPIGSPAALGGAASGGLSVEPEVSVDRAFGPMMLSMDIGARLRGTQTLDVRRFGNQFSAAASAMIATSPWRPEAILRMGVPLTANVPLGFEALLGARHDLGTPTLEAFALAGAGLGQLPGVPAYRGILGVAWRPANERAETVPSAPPPPISAPICPEPKPVAACPAAPDCPQPIVALVKAVPPPNPDDKDSDGDGVPDVVDNCPNVPGPAENHGCPVAQPQQVTIQRERTIHSRIKLGAEVNFANNRWTIERSSFGILNQLAEVIVAHPELAHLRVEGHTDSVGTRQKNIQLSDHRANAVRAYLENHGVPKGHLTAKGYADERPIHSNENEVGRAHNRRVEVVSEEET